MHRSEPGHLLMPLPLETDDRAQGKCQAQAANRFDDFNMGVHRTGLSSGETRAQATQA